MRTIIYTLLLSISVSTLLAQDFYLNANGVTCMCPDATFGDTGVVNGITYTKRTREQITEANAATTCTSGITNMFQLFADENATSFNQDISSWNVSKVINMGGMFFDATSFNQPIGGWDVSNVNEMGQMFHTSGFNQDIGDWDVSNVANMAGMFKENDSFNQNIGSWDVNSVTGMRSIFRSTINFNQDLSSWDVSNVTNMELMFFQTALSTENYDNILIGWAALEGKEEDVTLGAQASNYCLGAAARATMEQLLNWTFNDAGLDCNGLSTEDYLNSESITIFPNPTNDFLMINGIENSVNISIYNLLGAKVIAKSNTDKIDVSELSKGVYIINISDGVSQTNKKFIKN
jgi:surface protein